MAFWKQLVAKLQIAELKSLDLLEQIMKEEEQAKKKERFTSHGLSSDNILLVIAVRFLMLLAWRLYG
jgi:hypothetical protein